MAEVITHALIIHPAGTLDGTADPQEVLRAEVARLAAQLLTEQQAHADLVEQLQADFEFERSLWRQERERLLERTQ